MHGIACGEVERGIGKDEDDIVKTIRIDCNQPKSVIFHREHRYHKSLRLLDEFSVLAIKFDVLGPERNEIVDKIVHTYGKTLNSNNALKGESPAEGAWR